MTPSFPFYGVSYPCFELDAQLRVVDVNTAAAPLLQNRDMIRSMVNENEAMRLQQGWPIQLPWSQMPGMVYSLNILPLQNGYAALVQSSVERQNGYLKALEKTVNEVQGMFAALPMVQHFVEDGSQGAQLLEYAVRQSYRVLRTVTDQAWCVRLSTDSSLNLETIDLNEMIQLLCQAVNTAMPKLDNPIRCADVGSPVCVRADRALLELIITHLLNNSIAYASENCEVSVQVQVMKNKVLVHVSDSGMGIKPEIATHIFDPYFSSDPYCDTEEIPGSGLGLYLVQQGLRAMGGECALESEFGRGTHISFTLPLSEEEEPMLHTRLADYLMDRMSCIYLQFCPLGGSIHL